MNFGAQCFKFNIIIKWVNINIGAKLRCTKDVRKLTSYEILRIRCGHKRGNVRQKRGNVRQLRGNVRQAADICVKETAKCKRKRPAAATDILTPR